LNQILFFVSIDYKPNLYFLVLQVSHFSHNHKIVVNIFFN